MCLWLQFKTDTDKETFKKFFQEVQQAVDSKQLRPMIRTQYNRAAFQVPFDATVRISLDTNLAMIKENTDGQPVGLLHRSAFCLPFALPFALSLLQCALRGQRGFMIKDSSNGQSVGSLQKSLLLLLLLLFILLLLLSLLLLLLLLLLMLLLLLLLYSDYYCSHHC